MQLEYLGNKCLLDGRITAFLCSRTVGSGAVLRSYDWATDMAACGETVIGGFQSKIERDVLRFLLRGKQPVIMALARGMYSRLPEMLQQPMADGRLLIISTAPNAQRVSKQAAEERNGYIAGIAQTVVFGYIAEGSSLRKVYEKYRSKSRILYE